MSKHFYPAVFLEETDGFSVRFPDLEGCFTEGNTLEEAYNMAIDAIGLYLQDTDNQFSFPEASNPGNVITEKGEFVVLVEFDDVEYHKRHDRKLVKKTLTIPSWLNQAAEKEGVNFSATLKEALLEKLAR